VSYHRYERSCSNRRRNYEELERVFDTFPKNLMKILLGEFNAKVGRVDIFHPTIGIKVCTKLVMVIELD
jgi:hypothetical protein